MAKERPDYHISVESIFYPAPYEYINRQVDVKLSDDMLAVYFNHITVGLLVMVSTILHAIHFILGIPMYGKEPFPYTWTEHDIYEGSRKIIIEFFKA